MRVQLNSLGISVQLRQPLLSKVFAVPVSEQSRVALARQKRYHPLLLVLLTTLFWELIQQLQRERGFNMWCVCVCACVRGCVRVCVILGRSNLGMEREKVPVSSTNT